MERMNMSQKKCQMCDKTARTGNKRSHSNIATRRRFGANIQTKKIDGISFRLCTGCIRTLAKQEIK